MSRMHLPKFELLQPASMQAAAQLLNTHGSNARLVAGGTDIFARMKHGLVCPEVLVSLKGLSVDPPQVSEDGHLQIDALMPLADVARSAVVRERAPLLAEAALRVGSNQIRHMGTLGGNICLENRCSFYNQSHTYQFVQPCFKRNGDRCYLIPKGQKCVAVFMADTVPALGCLDAQLEILTADNRRQLAVEKLYTGNALQPLAIAAEEIVSTVIIPNSRSARGSAFSKFSLRGGLEFAALTVAVALNLADDRKTCAAARITVGAVSARPIRAVKAETAMAGELLSDKLFEKIAKLVVAEVQTVMHHDYSVAFLRECLKIQALRTLTMAAKRIEHYSKK